MALATIPESTAHLYQISLYADRLAEEQGREKYHLDQHVGFNLVLDGVGDFIHGLFGATAGTNYKIAVDGTIPCGNARGSGNYVLHRTWTATDNCGGAVTVACGTCAWYQGCGLFGAAPNVCGSSLNTPGWVQAADREIGRAHV